MGMLTLKISLSLPIISIHVIRKVTWILLALSVTWEYKFFHSHSRKFDQKYIGHV